jgi:IS30 family transposase
MKKNYEYTQYKNISKRGLNTWTLTERKSLKKLLDEGKSMGEICHTLQRSRSTIYYERTKLGKGVPYDPEASHKHAIESMKFKNNRRGELPLSYQKEISRMYKLLKALPISRMAEEVREKISYCIVSLETMGADPEKMKKPVTIEEEVRILKLYNDGESINKIQTITGRSRSSIWHVINKNKENENLEDLEYEKLTNKWATI